MFIGSVPVPVVEQITRIVPFSDYSDIFIGCSGSFRLDRAIKAKFPDVAIHSNDVSLLSVALGKLFIGDPFRLQFTGDLAFLEEDLPDPKDLSVSAFSHRIAAVLLGIELGKYTKDNEHNIAHFGHLRANRAGHLARGLASIDKLRESTRIDSFFAGDFRRMAERSREVGGCFVAYPPTYKGGYEKQYKFLDANTDWDRPDYDIWHPKNLEAFTLDLHESGAGYCVYSDVLFTALKPVAIYTSGTNKPIYTYARTDKASIRCGIQKATAFRYDPIVPDRLTAGSVVEIRAITQAEITFLKNVYLSKTINHTPGILNFSVYVDGMLVGGFTYNKSKFGGDDIYLLSDFSISRERKLSKLIALLATCDQAVSAFRKRYVCNSQKICTTAFTDKPVSMKYRGIYDLDNKKPGMLNYSSSVRSESPQELYTLWWRKWGKA